MTELQKQMLRASEIRQRLNELGGAEELGDEERAEIETLRTEYGEVETRQRALITAEDAAETTTTTESSEERELRELSEAVEFRNYIDAAVDRSPLTGAEKDYNAALDLGMDRFPLELLAPDVEERAAVDGDAARTQQSWIDRVFADSAAMALGVTMPSVAPGISAYPVLGSDAAPAQRGRAEVAVDATISATVTEIKPTRNSVRALYSIEDAARLPGFADSIRRDLSMAMTEKIDRTIFLGDAGASEAGADITGLTTAAITELELTQANKVKADEVLKLLAALIDGKYAASVADLNLVATVGSNALWIGTMQNANRNETVAQILRSNGVSWTTRGEIEDATADGDFGGFVGLARGIENCAVAPVWQSGQMIVDPYTGAAKGEVALTLHYLWGFAIPRAANFRRLKYVA